MKAALGAAAAITGAGALIYILLRSRKRQRDPGKHDDFATFSSENITGTCSDVKQTLLAEELDTLGNDVSKESKDFVDKSDNCPYENFNGHVLINGSNSEIIVENYLSGDGDAVSVTKRENILAEENNDVCGDNINTQEKEQSTASTSNKYGDTNEPSINFVDKVDAEDDVLEFSKESSCSTGKTDVLSHMEETHGTFDDQVRVSNEESAECVNVISTESRDVSKDDGSSLRCVAPVSKENKIAHLSTNVQDKIFTASTSSEISSPRAVLTGMHEMTDSTSEITEAERHSTTVLLQEKEVSSPSVSENECLVAAWADKETEHIKDSSVFTLSSEKPLESISVRSEESVAVSSYTPQEQESLVSTSLEGDKKSDVLLSHDTSTLNLSHESSTSPSSDHDKESTVSPCTAQVESSGSSSLAPDEESTEVQSTFSSNLGLEEGSACSSMMVVEDQGTLSSCLDNEEQSSLSLSLNQEGASTLLTNLNQVEQIGLSSSVACGEQVILSSSLNLDEHLTLSSSLNQEKGCSVSSSLNQEEGCTLSSSLAQDCTLSSSIAQEEGCTLSSSLAQEEGCTLSSSLAQEEGCTLSSSLAQEEGCTLSSSLTQEGGGTLSTSLNQENCTLSPSLAQEGGGTLSTSLAQEEDSTISSSSAPEEQPTLSISLDHDQESKVLLSESQTLESKDKVPVQEGKQSMMSQESPKEKCTELADAEKKDGRAVSTKCEETTSEIGPSQFLAKETVDVGMAVEQNNYKQVVIQKTADREQNVNTGTSMSKGDSNIGTSKLNESNNISKLRESVSTGKNTLGESSNTPKKAGGSDKGTSRKEQFQINRGDSAASDLDHDPISEQENLNSDSLSLKSVDSGQGSSEIEPETLFNPSTFPASSQEQYIFYEFEIPQTLVGRLIGKKGAFVNKIKATTDATVIVYPHRDRRLKLCSVEGSKQQVRAALDMIRDHFPHNRYPDVSLEQVSTQQPMMTPSHPTLNTQAMQIELTAGVVVEVRVSAVVSGWELWVQQPLHPSYSALHRLQSCMNLNYGDGSNTPPLPLPVQDGTVCVAQIQGQWMRCQALSTVDDVTLVVLLDLGGTTSLQTSSLRQIRYDYMTLPFQAAPSVSCMGYNQ